MPVFFAVSRYLRYKYFDVVWGHDPPRGSPQNQFFEQLNLRCQCFLISAVDILEINISTLFGGANPQGPPNRPPEINFFDWLKLEH